MKPYQAPVKRKEQDRARLGWTSLLWMFVGAIITLMIAVFLYLSPLFDSFKKDVDVNQEVPITPLPQEPQKPNEYEFYEILPERDFRSSRSGLGDDPAENDPSGAENKRTPNTEKARSPDVVVSAKTDDAQITITEEDETYDDSSSSPQATTNKIDQIQIGTAQPAHTYILQVRSYDNAEEADRKRMEVIMAGVDARVVHRVDPSGDSLYQVISVPFSSRVMAIEAEKKLSSNGIDSLLIEQRR